MVPHSLVSLDHYVTRSWTSSPYMGHDAKTKETREKSSLRVNIILETYDEK